MVIGKEYFVVIPFDIHLWSSNKWFHLVFNLKYYSTVIQGL